MEDETYIKKTYTIPASIVKRYEAYTKATPKREWFNASAIVSDALDTKLKEEGF
jgi:uncharacterized protein YndB with AHSA1/START domain